MLLKRNKTNFIVMGVLGFFLGFLPIQNPRAWALSGGACQASKGLNTQLKELNDLFGEVITEASIDQNRAYDVLTKATAYQVCVLQKNFKGLQRIEKDPEDRERLERIHAHSMKLHAQVLEVLKWSVRALNRDLMRNAASYAWDQCLPSSFQESACGYGLESSFGNLRKLAGPLKQSSIDVLQELNLVTPDGTIKFTNPAKLQKMDEEREKRDSKPFARRYSPNYVKERVIVSKGDLGHVFFSFASDCDMKSGNASMDYLLTLSDGGTLNLGDALIDSMGGLIESRKDPKLTGVERINEIKECVDRLPQAKAKLIESLNGKLARDLGDWGAKEIGETTQKIFDYSEEPENKSSRAELDALRKEMREGCKTELKELKGASENFKSSRS